MKEAITSDLGRCVKPGIPAYTQVELYEKFAPCLDIEDRAITCPKPSQAVYDAVKNEGRDRKKLKLELIEKKRRLQDSIMQIAKGEEMKGKVKKMKAQTPKAKVKPQVKLTLQTSSQESVSKPLRLVNKPMMRRVPRISGSAGTSLIGTFEKAAWMAGPSCVLRCRVTQKGMIRVLDIPRARAMLKSHLTQPNTVWWSLRGGTCGFCLVQYDEGDTHQVMAMLLVY